MQYRKDSSRLKKLLLGLLLRCPNCEQGRISRGVFHIAETCDVCDVRFERAQGESTGGMLVDMVTVLVLSVGLFIVLAASGADLVTQLVVLTVFISVFGVLFYRHARGLWIAITYLTGNVYADSDRDEG